MGGTFLPGSFFTQVRSILPGQFVGNIGTPLTTLTAALSDSVDPTINGKAIALSLVVTNTGTPSALSVSAAVTLDANLSFVSASGTGWTCNAVGQVVTCTRALLSAGAAPTITVNVTAANVAAVTASTSVAVTASNVTGIQSDTETTVLGFVARDATSGKYFPANATEWTAFMAGAGLATGGPGLLWGMQDASGNAADSIGSFTATIGAGPAYQTAIAGYSRKGISFADAAVTNFTTTSASLPDLTTNSYLVLAFANMATPAANRTIMSLGLTTRQQALVTTGPLVQVKCEGAGGTTVSGAANPTDAVRPFALRFNQTADTAALLTDQEVVTCGFGTSVAGKKIVLGLTCPATTWTYVAVFFSAAAELNNTQVSTLLTYGGWSMAY